MQLFLTKNIQLFLKRESAATNTSPTRAKPRPAEFSAIESVERDEEEDDLGEMVAPVLPDPEVTKLPTLEPPGKPVTPEEVVVVVVLVVV